MAKIKDKAKQIWEAITLPDGVDKEYDERCDNSFNKLFWAYLSKTFW